MLNIAEGSGRWTTPDKNRFFVFARASVFECVAIMDLLNELNRINDRQFNSYYHELEELSKILYSIIKKG